MASRQQRRTYSDFGYESDTDGSDFMKDIGIDVSDRWKKFQSREILTPRIFNDIERLALETETLVKHIADKTAAINRDGHSGKAAGSAISVVGGLMGLGGTVAAPFTFGLSLALAGVGVCMSVGGTAASSKAHTDMVSGIKEQIEQSKTCIKNFKDQFLKWITVANMLEEIIQDLQDMFSDLSCAFGHFIRSIENLEYKGDTATKAVCVLKCAAMFYGVTKTSTLVIRNVEELTRVVLNVKTVSTVWRKTIDSAKVLQATKVTVLKVAISKYQSTVFASKQVLSSGRHVVATVQSSARIGRSAKYLSHVSKGSSKVVMTKRTISAGSQSIMKETTKVTKTVSRFGVALGVVFVAYDLYEMGTEHAASKTTCDAEKELKSCIHDIQASSKEVMSNVEVYKQVMKIKEFFELMLHTLETNDLMVLNGVKMPLEKVKSFVDRIHELHKRMS